MNLVQWFIPSTSNSNVNSSMHEQIKGRFHFCKISYPIYNRKIAESRNDDLLCTTDFFDELGFRFQVDELVRLTRKMWNANPALTLNIICNGMHFFLRDVYILSSVIHYTRKSPYYRKKRNNISSFAVTFFMYKTQIPNYGVDNTKFNNESEERFKL